MKNVSKKSVLNVLVVSFALCLTGSITAFAATSPSLGNADSFSVLSGTTVTNTGATTISGNVGISPAGGGGYVESGTTTYGSGSSLHDADVTAANAQTDKNTAYGALAVPACGADGGQNYTGLGIHELAGEILPPGVYCADSFHLTNGTLTLNGPATGVWIFRSASDLVITGATSKAVFTGGGLACNVWWRVVSTASFDVTSQFIGNILADTSITMSTGATLDGRALARTASVTLDHNTISGPTCAAAVQQPGNTNGTITVIKTVINDNGGTKIVSDFPLFVNGVSVKSGDTNSFTKYNTYPVTETSDPQYTRTFSGDCDVNGSIYLNPNDQKICIITNNDIGAPAVIPPVPPLIDVVKVPNPLALPKGPGTVKYTYTLKNIGTVPVSNVTMVDDSCSAVTLISGDTNSDSKLDTTETWTYTCSSTLSATHTNIVVATGWANGISATDLASATVVVGTKVPPLIHVTKIPDPLTLLVGGGMVTYTEKITNPGTVALSNVKLSDDKCTPVKYVSGDLNNDSKLDPTETWTYTCRAWISETTMNTAVASGEANGFTVKDFAIATVVVATPVAETPQLPNTGFGQDNSNTLPIAALVSGIFAISLIVYIIRKRNRV